MTRNPGRILALVVSVGILFIAGCGDDDDTTPVGADDVTTDDSDDSDDNSSDSDDGSDADPGAGDIAPTGGGGPGSITIDGEEIALGPGRCFLEEQPAAAGGGSILLTAEAQGTNAAGEDVRLDFTRYSEDSQFAGDDVSLNVGPLTDSVSSSGRADAGTVTVDGSTVSATDFSLQNDDLQEFSVSFTIDCG